MAEDENAPAITAEEYTAWLTPAAALKLLNHLPARTAVLQIFERLRHGLLGSAAREFTYRGAGGEFMWLTTKMWENAATGITVSDFWMTGDITIEMQERSAGYGYQDFPLALFGVRFDPVGIQPLVPAKITVPPPPNYSGLTPENRALLETYGYGASSPAPKAEETPTPPVGPPVPDSLLNEWYSLYKRAYPGPADTEAVAIRSAEGMFPGKSVVRQRVRDLRGKQKRGPKPREEPQTAN